MIKNEQNIDGKCLFLITMKKCKVKINDNIFSEGELFPLNILYIAEHLYDLDGYEK